MQLGSNLILVSYAQSLVQLYYSIAIKIGLMHDTETSREIKKSNGTLKTTKIKNSAAPVDREKNFA